MMRRLSVILFFAAVAGAGLYAFQRYLDNPNSAINRFVPPSWQTKSRLRDIAAQFPLAAVTGGTAATRRRPPRDLAAPGRTETALFALG